MIHDIDFYMELPAARVFQKYIDRWCYFGGGSKTETTAQNQVQTNTTDPELKALLMQNYDTAKSNAGSLTPYTGQLTAGLNPTQIQAQGILSGIGTDTSGQSAINGATQAVSGVMNNPVNGAITATPTTAAQVGAPSNVNAGMLSSTDLSPYMNPFQNDVINASIADNERARQMAQVSDSQRATAAGAFGGSRSGVSSALTNGEYDRNNQSNIAGLNAANFTQAQGAATNDINRQLGADQYNNTNAINANQYNANNQQNTGQFNATQDMNAQQNSFANQLASAGLTLNAAGQIVSLNNAGLTDAATRAGILGSVGDVNQQQQQSQLDSAYQEFLRQQGFGAQQQGILNAALGLLPNQQTVTTNGTGTNQTKTNSGFGGILSSLGSIASGAAMLSDVRTKSDVQTIGHDAKGRRWVSFRYNWEAPGTYHEGVIAQEVLKTDPDAVIMGDDGLYRVYYDKLKGSH